LNTLLICSFMFDMLDIWAIVENSLFCYIQTLN